MLEIFKCRRHGLDSNPDCLTCSIVKAENAHINAMAIKEEDKEGE